MDEFQKAINDALNTKLKQFERSLRLDRTITAKVLSFDSNSKAYTLLYNGSEIEVRARGGLTLESGDIVYVRLVQGDFSNKFIDCKKP